MKTAFTLIELSIVLVIIGLLVGGVLVGKDLIRVAELKSQISQQENILLAINTFKLKYNCLPGDCANATQFFGMDSNCPNTTFDNTPKTATCNGDGNGRIGNWYEGVPQENQRFWQHLASAGLIDGQYTGVRPTGYANWNSGAGISSPYGKIKQTAYNIYGTFNNSGTGVDTVGGTTVEFWTQANYYTLFFLATPTQASGYYVATRQNSITPTDMLYIDTKIDDGIPAQGRVLTSPYDAPNCTSAGSTRTATPSTVSYNLTNTNKICALAFNEKL